MTHALIVVRNIGRNPRRTILTVLAIALAILAYTTVASFPYLLSRILGSPYGARRIVSTNKSGFFQYLPEAYRDKIRAIPHVEATTAIVLFGGEYHSPSDRLGFAVDPDAGAAVWPDWGFTQGRAAMLAHERTACLVPRALMRRFKWHVGQQIILKGTLYPVNLTLRIADTLGPKAPPDALMFRRDYLDELLGSTGRVNAYYSIVDSKKAVPATIAAIDETFSNSSAETNTASEAAFVLSMFDYKTLLLAFNAIALVAVLAMSLVVVNTMAMAARERRGEAAVMRALGFPPFRIAILTLAESAAIGVAGGVTGCAIAYGAANLLPFSALAFGPVDLFDILPGGILIRALLLSIAIGLGAGLIALPTLSRHAVAESLRWIG
jgi:putative ABC transport system permease protein